MDAKIIVKRNFTFLMLEGTFIVFAVYFLDSNSVIPVFIDAYTGSIQLAGLATTLRMAFLVIPPIIIGPFVHGIRDMAAFVRCVMLIFRPLFLLMVPVLLLIANPHAVVWIFLAIYSLYCISEGIISVPWWELFSRTVPNERRGKLLGYQQFLGGIGGIIGGLIIKIVLEDPGLSNNLKFTIIFGIAGLLAFASAAAMIPVKDLPREISKEKADLLGYFGRMPGYVIKSRGFVKLSFAQAAAGIGGMAGPFIVLFGKGAYRFDATQISNLIYLQIIGTLIGGILWGTVSHRIGNRYVIIIAQAASIVINAAALFSYQMKLAFIPYLIILLAGMNMGSWMGVMNYLLEVVKEEDRPVYLVLNNLVTIPISVIPYLAGLIAGSWGFLPLFSIGLAGAISAFVLSLMLEIPKKADGNP